MAEAWVGIDLGTSSVKCLALDAAGTVLAVAQERYSVDRPSPGWAEQDAEAWWRATAAALASMRAALPPGTALRGIGLSGQMHGVVLVDAQHAPVRPAIIWSDGRAEDEVARWRAEIGDDVTEKLSGFRAASGMAGVSLSWLMRHEPEALARTSFVMQPKDFIRLRLTGEAALELTDAGASLLFDLDRAAVAPEFLAASRIDESLIPGLVGTLDIAGRVTAAAAERTGLTTGIPVAAGGGDQAMAALALGLDGPDRAAVSLSSGGTVVVPLTPGSQVPGGYHRLASAVPGSMFAMGVVLAAGLATDWLGSLTGRPTVELLESAADVEADASLIALPGLGGTRTPQVSSARQGAFAGLGFHHSPAHLMRALVEGAAISLADSLAEVQRGTQSAASVVLSGGGARFAVWRQAVADAAGVPVVVSSDLEHSALGAALAGAAADGADIGFEPRSRVREVVEPNSAAHDRLQNARARREALLEASIEHRRSEIEGKAV